MCASLAELSAASDVGFGTSGVRALVTALEPPIVAAYVLAFLSLLKVRPGHVLIGQDLRPSSAGIAAACHWALRREGVEAVNAGALPTPALATAALALGLPAIMVTGSHIPFDRNGLKFYRAEGEITKADEQRMLAFAPPPDLGALAARGALPPEDGRARALYLARYGEAFDGALRGMRIGIYEHSSVARDLLHDLLRRCGAETIGLGRSDDFVAVDTEAVRPEDSVQAAEWAAAHRLDALVTTDGDADRPLLADEAGRFLRGDVLGFLAARELQAASVVTPLSSTTAIEACGAFQDVRRTRIGSPHVIAGMEQARHAPVVGFEANGGFLLGSAVRFNTHEIAPLMTRDAVLPLLLVLSAARRSGSPLSQLLPELPQRHTASGRLQEIDVAACRTLLTETLADNEAAARLLGGGASALLHVDRMDGVRAQFASGDIVHVRASGNAPELRCYSESGSPEAAERLWQRCLSRLAPRVSGRPDWPEETTG